MEPGRWATLFTVIGLLAACSSRGGDPTPLTGHLFIVGGGAQPDELVARFVELAGGPGQARIAVIPLASGSEVSGLEKAEQLREFGAKAWVLTPTRAEAGQAEYGRQLDSASGIWFTGGDQVLITAVIAGTPLRDALAARYEAGAVIGGTSAGAAIMSDSMLTGNQRRADSLGYYGDTYPAVVAGSIEIVPGLGFLPGTIVDQHFHRRERHNRLLSAVLERPTLIGVGIDEGTALEVGPEGRWTVRGASSISVYDARRATTAADPDARLGARGVTLHVLLPGQSFDPRRP